jgi:hypothetical protein
LHRRLLYWYRRFFRRYPFPSSSSRLQFGSLLQLNILNILIMPLLIASKYILSPQIWRLPSLLCGSTYTTSLAALYAAITRESNRDQCSETMEGALDLVLELWLKAATGGLKSFYVIFLWKNPRGFHTCARDFFTSHTIFHVIYVRRFELATSGVMRTFLTISPTNHMCDRVEDAVLS